MKSASGGGVNTESVMEGSWETELPDTDFPVTANRLTLWSSKKTASVFSSIITRLFSDSSSLSSVLSWWMQLLILHKKECWKEKAEMPSSTSLKLSRSVKKREANRSKTRDFIGGTKIRIKPHRSWRPMRFSTTFFALKCLKKSVERVVIPSR